MNKIALMVTQAEIDRHEQARERIIKAAKKVGMGVVFIVDGWPGYPWHLRAKDGPSIVNFHGKTDRIVRAAITKHEMRKDAIRKGQG